MLSVGGLQIDGWDVAAIFVEAVAVEPVDPFGGGQFNLPDGVRQGVRGLISSVLYRPLIVSANALSYDDPTDPTRGCIPASASCSGEQYRGVHLGPVRAVRLQAQPGPPGEPHRGVLGQRSGRILLGRIESRVSSTGIVGRPRQAPRSRSVTGSGGSTTDADARGPRYEEPG